MKSSYDMLSSIIKTTQMGQIGIRSVLDAPMSPGIKKALHSQLKEYDAIETEAHGIASRRGWEIPELYPGTGLFTDMMIRMKLGGRNTDSQIAGMFIKSNTKDIIKGIRNLNQLYGKDEPLQILSQKLLDCETANIRQMQNFL